MTSIIHMAATGVSGRFSEQKEQRYAYKRSGGEADQLPLGQIEHDLCFEFSLSLWYGYISQCGNLLPFLVRLKD